MSGSLQMLQIPFNILTLLETFLTYFFTSKKTVSEPLTYRGIIVVILSLSIAQHTFLP